MDAPFLTFLRLIAPVVFGVISISFQFFLKQSEKAPTKVVFNIGIISLERYVVNEVATRIILVILTLACFAFPAFRDYTKLFPVNLKMEVYFDDDGIRKSLSEFTSREIKSLKVKEDWERDKSEYLAKLNKETKKLGIMFQFDSDNSIVHSKGRTHFEVQKVKDCWQEYQIVDAKGYLDHVYEAPGIATQQLTSEFELLNTDANRLRVLLSGSR